MLKVVDGTVTSTMVQELHGMSTCALESLQECRNVIFLRNCFGDLRVIWHVYLRSSTTVRLLSLLLRAFLFLRFGMVYCTENMETGLRVENCVFGRLATSHAYVIKTYLKFFCSIERGTGGTGFEFRQSYMACLPVLLWICGWSIFDFGL